MSRFLDIESNNPKVTQNQKAQQLNKAESTIKNLRDQKKTWVVLIIQRRLKETRWRHKSFRRNQSLWKPE